MDGTLSIPLNILNFTLRLNYTIRNLCAWIALFWPLVDLLLLNHAFRMGFFKRKKSDPKQIFGFLGMLSMTFSIISSRIFFVSTHWLNISQITYIRKAVLLLNN